MNADHVCVSGEYFLRSAVGSGKGVKLRAARIRPPPRGAPHGTQLQRQEHTVVSEIRIISVAVAFGLGVMAVSPARAGDAASVSVKDGHLAGNEGMSLYLFESDQQSASTCYDACAGAWPPLITDGAPKAEGDSEASLLGTTERKDGSMQATYNGWPLYYFVKDKKPGDTMGQDKKGFGGEWYLVEPSGEAME
jgi:predicted lipoprotein with Yx(FWY)xxD motif